MPACMANGEAAPGLAIELAIRQSVLTESVLTLMALLLVSGAIAHVSMSRNYIFIITAWLWHSLCPLSCTDLELS